MADSEETEIANVLYEQRILRDSDDYKKEIKEEPVVLHRVFMNHVDQYHGRHIAEFLTDQIYGASKSVGEEMEEEEIDEVKAPQIPGYKYEVIGTMKNIFAQKSEDILYTISESDTIFLSEVLKCGIIVYDITQDSNEIPKALALLDDIEKKILEIQQIGPKTYSHFDRTFVFVLISNVMTWGKTKPLDPTDPEIPFNEVDYKKRKPHPNYLDQIACEREVILKGKKYKDKLKTYVVCSGLTYGFEEEDLLFYFKMAWNNIDSLPVFGPGNNIIPLIHIQDLAKVLHGIFETLPNKPQYILAVEQAPCKLKQIVKAISKTMTRGRIKEVSKEEAFLYKSMKQELYDRLTLNLNMEPSFILEELGIEFRSDLNFAENIKKIVEEFRSRRVLLPLRILIHGPPASGKTTLAKKLVESYGVHYISVKTLIEETLENLKADLAEELKNQKLKADKADIEDQEVDEEAEPEEEEEINIDDIKEEIRDIETTLEKSEDNKLPDEYVLKLLQKFLASNICQNQGYVLDGYPRNITQVNQLFGKTSEGEDEELGEEEESEESKGNSFPTHIISLEADDNFLCERVMNFAESEIQGTHYTEEHMLRRLKEFRSNNTEDNTMLNFFDENEVFAYILNITDAKNINLVQMVQEHIGPVGGFEITDEEKEEIKRCEEEMLKLKNEEKKIAEEILERQALIDYQIKMEERIKILEELHIEEEKLIAAQCEPLRTYLMKYIFPTLTEGLLEIARIKPTDPVDYLAEYLFKCNPEGKMFDPAYTKQGELIKSVMEDVMKKSKNY